MRTVEKAGIAAIVLASAGGGFLSARDNLLNHEQPASSEDPNDSKSTTPSQPLSRDFSTLTEQEKIEEATTIIFIFKPRDFNRQYDNWRYFRSRDQLIRQAQGIVLEEAEFYRQVQKDPPVLISRAKDKIKVGDKVYDLTTSKGLLFADAVFEILYRERFGIQVPWIHSDTDSLDDVEELYDRMPVLESDDKPFSAADSLVSLDRALKILKSVGQQVPTKILLNYSRDIFPSQGGVMRFNQHTFKNLAEYYAMSHPTLSREFQDIGAFDLVNDFTVYINNGRAFRRLILYLETTGDESVISLKQRYDFFRRFFKTDFSIRGQPKDLYDYHSGDIVEIDDPEEKIDANNIGILLRPGPRLDRDPNWPYVRNGRLVKVINDQVQIVLDEGAREGVEMLQVEAGEIIYTEQGRFWMPLIPPQRGWMQKDYLGSVVGN